LPNPCTAYSQSKIRRYYWASRRPAYHSSCNQSIYCSAPWVSHCSTLGPCRS